MYKYTFVEQTTRFLKTNEKPLPNTSAAERKHEHISRAPFPSSCSLSPRATSPTLLQPSPSSKSRPPQVPKSHGLQCFFPKLVRTTHTQNKFGQNALVAVGIMSTHAQNDNVNKCKRKRDKHPGKFETTWSTTTRQVFWGKITRITFER